MIQDNMKTERQIEQIINTYLPAISSGEESLASILARYPQFANELRPRLEAVIWLQQVRLSVATRPGFIHDSRKHLEAQIKSMPPLGFWGNLMRQFTPQRWVFNIFAPIVVLLLLALVINNAVLTARLSIPGDPLYSTKLVIEDIQLALTFDQVNKTELHIQLSRERTLEFIELVMEGDYVYLPNAARRMETEIDGSLLALNNVSTNDPAIQTAMVTDLRDILSNELFMLDVLKGTSPTLAQPGIELAIQVAQSGILALR
jgi:hypothetical protein